jgi:hypothetical protein
MEREGATLAFARLGGGVTLLTFSGFDRGQFGDAPFAELARDLERHPVIELFIDTRGAVNAVGAVTAQWSAWIQTHHRALRRMSVLVSSPFVELTAEIVKLFSRVEHLVRIYTDVAAFEAAIRGATGRPFELSR